MKLFSGECPRTSIMRHQNWFRWWLGAVRQAMTLRHCWPISMSPYGVTRSQWVKALRLQQNCCNKMAVILQTFHLNFPDLHFDLNFTLSIKSTLVHWMAWCHAGRQQAIMWTNDVLVYWGASLSLDELTLHCQSDLSCFQIREMLLHESMCEQFRRYSFLRIISGYCSRHQIHSLPLWNHCQLLSPQDGPLYTTCKCIN